MRQRGEISGRSRRDPDRVENAASRARCTAKKTDGSPCRGIATVGEHCPIHSPQWSEAEKNVWRKRGRIAQQKAALATFPPCDFASEEGCRRALELAGDAVLKGRLPTSSANALAKLAAVGLKAAELGVARRLASIEQTLKDAAPARGKKSR